MDDIRLQQQRFYISQLCEIFLQLCTQTFPEMTWNIPNVDTRIRDILQDAKGLPSDTPEELQRVHAFVSKHLLELVDEMDSRELHSVVRGLRTFDSERFLFLRMCEYPRKQSQGYPLSDDRVEEIWTRVAGNVAAFEEAIKTRDSGAVRRLLTKRLTSLLRLHTRWNDTHWSVLKAITAAAGGTPHWLHRAEESAIRKVLLLFERVDALKHNHTPPGRRIRSRVTG